MAFLFVSDHLALDFAGTVAWRDTRPVHLLTEPADLLAWAAQAGLLPPDPPEVTAAGFAAALALREAVYRAAGAAADGAEPAPADLGLIRAAAARPPLAPELGGVGVLHYRGGLDSVLATIAVAASELLGGPDHVRIRRCEGQECTRLYVDRSRAGNRRWCSKFDCGNRANTASYRRRRGGSG